MRKIIYDTIRVIVIYKVTEDEDKKSWRIWRLFRHFHVNITPEKTHLHSPHYISLGSSFFDSVSKKGPIKVGQPRTISFHGNDVNCSLKSACWRWKWHKKWSAGASEEHMCVAMKGWQWLKSACFARRSHDETDSALLYEKRTLLRLPPPWLSQRTLPFSSGFSDSALPLRLS